MTSCRVCGAPLGEPIYHAGAPAITSLSTVLDVETTVYLCRACCHVQSPAVTDLDAFYANEYRISLDSDDHDQLYEMRGGEPVYRTAHQAALALRHAAPPQGAKVLDFGAAKAATLRALARARPDIAPHVFDVSDDYRGSWAGWILAGAQATHELPAAWDERFDLVTAHFVLEHVEAPVESFKRIARLLAPGGRAFVTVPDVLSNPGDLLVVDHVNHFTQPSIRDALARAGLTAEAVLDDAFRGAFVIVAAGAKAAADDAPAAGAAIDEAVRAVSSIADFWRGARKRLLAASADGEGHRAAIYGAGFYGTFVATTLAGRQPILGHLDRNPHVRAASTLQPIFDPADPPDGIERVYAGLNPLIARQVIGDWLAQTGLNPEVIYLDGADAS